MHALANRSRAAYHALDMITQFDRTRLTTTTPTLQLTVRMVTEQSMRGGPPKRCVDYVVFERNLEDKSVTKWRIAGKVMP